MIEEKKKILIVEDDTFLLDMYAFKFSHSNYEVYTATGSTEALAKLKEGLKLDVILMDVIMPEMDGFEMLEKIKADKLSEDSVKIILSNKSEQSDVERGNLLGVSGYIIKASSTPAEVMEKVTEILAKKSVVK